MDPFKRLDGKSHHRIMNQHYATSILAMRNIPFSSVQIQFFQVLVDPPAAQLNFRHKGTIQYFTNSD